MSFIVIVTHLEGPGDFEVVGAFAEKDEATAWCAQAFFDPKWKDCLFRVKEMRALDAPPPQRDFGEVPL